MFSLKDSQIRPILHSYLKTINQNFEDTKIVDEFELFYGLSRVDIAVINGLIHGYEIKSEVDNLNRLSNQIKYYNKSLEKVTIAVASSHLKKVLIKIPDWWGVLLINSKKDIIYLDEIRKAEINPNIDNSSQLFLLWKDELLIINNKFNLSTKSKDNKKKLIENITFNINKHKISYEVREALKSRKNWRSCSTTTVK